MQTQKGSISKIPVFDFLSHTEDIYYLQFDYADRPFKLTLIGNRGTWSGTLTEDAMLTFSREVQETPETYFVSLKNAFFNKTEDHVHHFTSAHDGIADFQWRRKHKFTCLGSVRMMYCREKKKMDLIHQLVARHFILKQKLKACGRGNKRLEHKLSEDRKDREEDLKIKIVKENELFTRFVKLLNEKSVRIILLQRDIERTLKEVQSQAEANLKEVEDQTAANLQTVEEHAAAYLKKVEDQTAANLKEVEKQTAANLKMVEDLTVANLKKVDGQTD